MWGPQEPPALKQTPDFSCYTGRAFCDVRLAQRNVQIRGAQATQSVLRLTGHKREQFCSEMNHAVLPYSAHDGDFTSAPIEESCFGSKRADTPAFPKQTCLWEAKRYICRIAIFKTKKAEEKKKKSDRWLFVCGGLGIGGGLPSKPQPLI